jgi:hypothetical protein
VADPLFQPPRPLLGASEQIATARSSGKPIANSNDAHTPSPHPTPWVVFRRSPRTNGAISYTRLMSMAQVWLQRAGMETGDGKLSSALAACSAGMQYFNGSYTSYFNRRHRRCGHLFQGRFKGHLIEEDGYFLEVSRYIHLNPVRAKVVARPEQYPWSSYRGYQRASRTVDWVTYDRVLGEFGASSSLARGAYTRFVRAGIRPERLPRRWAIAAQAASHAPL